MIDNRLVVISERWNKVEQRLKEIENLDGRARIPAINELRYAGRQIVDALTALSSNSTADVTRNVTSALQYVQNADHDITDAMIDFFRSRIQEALKECGDVNVAKNFPNIFRMRDLIFSAEEKIRRSREDRGNRDKYYEDIYVNHVVELIELYKEFRVAEPGFLYDQLLLSKKYRVSRIMNYILAACTILGFVYGALSYYGI